jgi:hypothetical protein
MDWTDQDEQRQEDLLDAVVNRHQIPGQEDAAAETDSAPPQPPFVREFTRRMGWS